MIGRVVEHHLGAAEQIAKIIHPALLQFHLQAALPQGWQQLLTHIGTALAGLHQHINRAFTGAPAKAWIDGIGHPLQGCTGRTIAPVAQGVAAHRQHRHPCWQIKAIATAMGVISHRPAPQLPQQLGHMKTPTHQPEGFTR